MGWCSCGGGPGRRHSGTRGAGGGNVAPGGAKRNPGRTCLDEAIQPAVYAFLGSLVRDEGGVSFAVNGMPEHVHLLARLPASRALSDVVRAFKANSSSWLGKADFDVAVRLSIDGLDQFVFADKEFRDKDGKPSYEYMIVGARKTTVIRGWFRNLKKADAFLVTEYAKSAVAELNASQGEVGVICVQFHAAWKTEAELRAESAKDATATGRGKPVDVDLKVAARYVGVLRDQVAVRYTK